MNIDRASHTDVVTFLRCPKSFEYRVVQTIQAKRQDGKLTMGKIVHRFLQEHDLGNGIEMAWGTFMDDVETTALNDEELVAGRRLVEDARGIYERYLFQWAEDSSHMKTLHVEEEFVLTWEDEGRTFSIRCTPDKVEQDERTGVIWVRDYKTTDSIPDSREVPTYQIMLYVAAVQAAYPDHRVGFVLDYLRRKTPVVPRLNKTKGKDEPYHSVNNLRVVDTTYELLLEFLENEAPHLLDDPDHTARLAELFERNNFFQRDIVFLTEAMTGNVLSDVTETLLNIERAERFPRMFISTGGSSCDRCEFKPLCLAELRGEDTESLRAAFYETREPKNPYEREEENA